MNSSSIPQKPSIIKTFAPGWFASVMGTAVTVVALFVFQSVFPFSKALETFFLLTSILLFLVLIIPWIMRWFLYPVDVRHDLSHPVSAAFFPTMPISMLIIGIALEKIGADFLSEYLLWNILQILWVAGTMGIFVFALAILNTFFHKTEVQWETSTLGWLIPPVSALLVPVLGISLSTHFQGTTWGAINLITSLIFTGFGSLLFIFVMSLVFIRYIFHPMPPAHLAPTMWVGVAPTSILTILALKFGKPLALFFQATPEIEQMLNFLSKPLAVMLWGFALFWLFLALIVTLGVHQKSPIPFALSWWAFVFPVGAFTVSTGVLFQAIPLAFFQWVGLSALTFLLILWLVVAANTVIGVGRGSIFAPHAPAKH
jgi:C4-dicarboxylate transporter/malic acid transport protein